MKYSKELNNAYHQEDSTPKMSTHWRAGSKLPRKDTTHMALPENRARLASIGSFGDSWPEGSTLQLTQGDSLRCPSCAASKELPTRNRGSTDIKPDAK